MLVHAVTRPHSVLHLHAQVDPHFLDSETESDLGDDDGDEDDEGGAVAAVLHPPQPAISADSVAMDRTAGQQGASTGAQPAQQPAQTHGSVSGGAAEGSTLAERSGEAGPGPGSEAAARAAPAGSGAGRAVGAKAKRVSNSGAPTATGDTCDDDSQVVDGQHLTKGARRPRHRAKKMHDLSDISSVGIMAKGALDEYRFNMFMRDLLAEKAKDIFRCKGFLCIHVSHSTLHAWAHAAGSMRVRAGERLCMCLCSSVPG